MGIRDRRYRLLPRYLGAGQDGFVLADVLVSLIITSLVIGVLLAAVSQSAVSTQRTGDQYRAISYARSKLAELSAAQSLVEGVAEGRFDDLFSWSLTVRKDPQLSLAHDAAPLVAVDVELKVSWRRGGHRYERSYRTLMLRPKSQSDAQVISRPGTRSASA